MTGATGLEPATSGVTGRRSNQLSYAPAQARGKQPPPRARAQVCQDPTDLAGSREILAACRALPSPPLDV
jgi:hypothetical protein